MHRSRRQAPAVPLNPKAAAYTAGAGDGAGSGGTPGTASHRLDQLRDERIAKLKHELRAHIRHLNDYAPLEVDQWYVSV